MEHVDLQGSEMFSHRKKKKKNEVSETAVSNNVCPDLTFNMAV